MQTIEDIYPSRIGDRAELMERRDPVVWSEPGHPGPLDGKALASYEAKGFLALQSLFDADEIAEINEELLAWLGAPGTAGLEEAITEPGSGAVRSVFRVHELHPRVAALARDERLAGAARQILGSDVYIHQSRVNLKPGFRGKEFYWHSDFETWHVEDGMPRMRALSVSLALTENLPFNGALMLMPGSHKTYITCVGETPENHYQQSLKRQEYGVPDPDSLTALAAEHGIEMPTGPAGTALFFDCNTMHGSNSNISPFPRSNVFFVYNSIENAVQDPFCGLAPRPAHIATRGRFQKV